MVTPFVKKKKNQAASRQLQWSSNVSPLNITKPAKYGWVNSPDFSVWLSGCLAAMPLSYGAAERK